VVLAFGFSFEYKGRDAFIDELFLKEAYRKKGIGGQTMRFVEQQAKELGVHAIHLEVEKSNRTGAGFTINKATRAKGCCLPNGLNRFRFAGKTSKSPRKTKSAHCRDGLLRAS